MAEELQVQVEPVDAYVFIDHVDPGANIRHVLDDLFAQEETVRFAAQTVGSFIGFAAVHTSTIDDLHRLMAGDYWSAGVHCKWSTIVIPGPLHPKIGSPPACALVRIGTNDKPVNVLSRLIDGFQEWVEPRHFGSAVVTGEYDILVSIGSDSFEEVATAILGPLRDTEGVASTDTAFMALSEKNKRERVLKT